MIVAAHLTGVRLIEQLGKDVHLRQRHLLAHKICLMPMFYIRKYRARAHANQRMVMTCGRQIHRFIIVSVTNYNVQMEESALRSGLEA